MSAGLTATIHIPTSGNNKGRSSAVAWYEAGYGEHLLSVIPPPPIATLSPDSHIKPEAMGKAAGRRNGSGRWSGYNWRTHRTTRAEAEKMDADRANLGLKAALFPGFDIDATDERLAAAATEVLESFFPGAAYRVGNSPKRLYPFRLAAGADPFRKRILAATYEGKAHKVEALGNGQYYVVSGFHPVTRQQYLWTRGAPVAADLPEIDSAMVGMVLAAIQAKWESMGAVCGAVSGGGGGEGGRATVDQESLKAKDLDLLRRVMEFLPNDYADRGDYIRVGVALCAATQDDPELGRELFPCWAAKWEGGNEPDEVEADWDSFTQMAPWQIGAQWLYDLAQGRGFNMAVEEFAAVPGVVAPEVGTSATAPDMDRSLVPLMRPDYSNDDGNAERFVRLYGEDVKYCIERKCWFVWDGRRWNRDDGPAVERRAVESMHEFLKQAAVALHVDSRERLIKFAVESRNARRIQALLAMAKSKLAVSASQFDTNPYLLNFQNGTLDVRTGSLSPHDRRHLITRIVHCNYNPAAKCPRFLDLLAWVMEGAPEMVGYLQRAFGYSLTGSTQDKVFFVCHGPSNTGKTTVLRTVMRTFKEYSTAIQMESLTQRPGFESSNAQSDLADLNGTRFALTSETEKGLHFNEALIKRITQGGGRIKYARKYENPVEFEETHKLWFDANHMPVAKDGTGLFERLRQIPFNNVVTDDRRDNGLGEKLAAEMEGVAAWVAAGAIEWAARGSLGEPEQVKRAGAEYKRSQDSVEGWARACLIPDPEGRATFRELQGSYEAYCQRMHRTPIDPHLLPDQLRRRGLSNTKVGGQRGWRGAKIGGDEFDVVEDGE